MMAYGRAVSSPFRRSVIPPSLIVLVGELEIKFLRIFPISDFNEFPDPKGQPLFENRDHPKRSPPPTAFGPIEKFLFACAAA